MTRAEDLIERRAKAIFRAIYADRRLLGSVTWEQVSGETHAKYRHAAEAVPEHPDLGEAVRLLREGYHWLPAELDDRVHALLSRHLEKPKLLPCPFCGGTECTLPYKPVTSVVCRTCGLEVRAADAIAAWNRRAS